jgi:HEAT repeat protein
MKRLVPFAGMLMLVPMLAAAQTVPPPPPPPDLPRPVAVPPIPPEPPRVLVAPTVIDSLAIDQAVRAVREAAQTIDSQAIREATERARAEVERAREQMDRTRDLMQMDIRMPDMRMENMHIDMLDMQDRAFAYNFQDSEGSAYSSGLSLLTQRQYDQAIVRFDRTISQKGAHADGALYWKAFAQFKLGKGQDALETIGALRKDFPQSRYLNDAKVLEADVKKPAIGAIDDDEIKLLAIQGIQNSDPVRAAQLAEKLLASTNSLQVKRRALYILALSDQPSAHELLLSYAKGNGNPDLQREAISYLATRRTKQPTTAADLRQIYESTTDANIKRAIIDAYRTTGDKTSLIAIASSGTPTPVDLRTRAISNLTDLAAPQELWTLYQKEQDKDLRIAMVRAFSSMGAVDQLLQVAKTDKDPAVRQQAVRSLGSQKVDKTGTTLVDMYGTEQDKDTKLAIIAALGNQNNDTGLVAIARKETTNIELKREIVRKLAEMSSRSKVAADYLLEVIK